MSLFLFPLGSNYKGKTKLLKTKRVSRPGVAEKVPQATLGSDSPFTQLVPMNTHAEVGCGLTCHWALSGKLPGNQLGRQEGAHLAPHPCTVFSKLPVEHCLQPARWMGATCHGSASAGMAGQPPGVDKTLLQVTVLFL